ncbi:MAG: CPBP family intramembrane metalloprotease [Proteobacteria bacterium]|nr:CPBP family intramembrane metalloprotease [Pseudomonadota bacterium]
MFLFVAALAAFGLILRLLLGPELLEMGPLALMGVVYAILLCSVLVAVVPLGRRALPAMGICGAGWKPIVLGSVGTLVLSVAVSRIGPEVKGMQAVEELVRQPDALVPSLLLLGGLAPIVEELVFRGLLYGWIAGRWGTRWAWLVSSIAFAVAHYEPAHIMLVLPLGLLFGYLRRRTDSLLPSTVAHIFNNSFAVAAAAYLDM